MKILITVLVVLFLTLTVLSRIGGLFGYRHKPSPRFIEKGLFLSSILLLAGIAGYFLKTPADRDISLLAGPVILFLICADMWYRQRKAQ